MIAELSRCPLEDDARTFDGQWRHGIGLGARRVERTGAGKPGNADLPLNLGVIRLEVRVTNRPVDQSGSGNLTHLAALDKINLVETPEVGSEMDAAATHATTVHYALLNSSLLLRRLPESRGLNFRIVGQ